MRIPDKGLHSHKLQHEYINTSIHRNHHTEEQDLTTDEIKQKIRMTSTLLIPGSRPGTYPLIEEAEEELQTSEHRSHVKASLLPVVICEPRGLNNPITMGIKTSKA